VLFDGTHDYLSIASVPELQLGTTDFTIEAWINFEAVSGSHQQIVAAGNPESANSFVVQVREDGSDRLLDFRTDTRSITSTSPIPTNKWTHIAVTKQSNLVRLFINGVLENSGTEAESLTTAITAIGYRSASSYGYAKGYISNLRILKGTALYTSDFTVPVHALEVIGDTVLLCCNNPDSVTAASNAGIGTALNLTANEDPIVSTVSPGLTRDFTSGTEFSGVTVFDTQGYFVPPSGTTEQRGRGRGLFGGGSTPTRQNIIDFVNIASTGNTQDFGDLTRIVTAVGGCASATRGLFGGGYNPSVNNNTIEFVTIATTGNAINFGDLAYTPNDPPGGLSNNTRGIFAGGEAPAGVNNINFVTIASLGDATDFGDLFKKRRQYFGSCSSPTRGLFAGGYDDTSPASRTNVIEYITIATAGNGLNFGDLNAQLSFGIAGVSSKTRGVFMGGYTAPDGVNTIQYVTISTLGNAQDFGDLTISALARSSGVSNSERGLAAGGATPTLTNTIDYITIATTGDAKDFGDLLLARRHPGGLSDSHGGIS
jgi:hypothetical protein